jgi:hypothetical protein
MFDQAQELTDEEQEARATRAFELAAQIKQALNAGRQAMWDVARAAHEFDEEAGWSALGYDTLGQWLADPEVSMSRSTFFRVVKVYRELVVRRQLPASTLRELDISKVDIVLAKVKSGKIPLNQALEDSRSLGAKDLREEYYDRPDPKIAADAANEGDDDEPIPTPDAPEGPPVVDSTPVIASAVEVDAEVEAVPTEAEDVDDSLAESSLAERLAEILQRVWDEVAPVEKKRISNDLRFALHGALEAARADGLLDR